LFFSVCARDIEDLTGFIS